jgi:hypothetical protein
VSRFGDDRYTPEVAPEAPRAAIAVAERLAAQLLQRAHLLDVPVRLEAAAAAERLQLIHVAEPTGPDGELRAAAGLIIVNTHRRAPTRVRFTIAHELGHWCLGHHRLPAADALLQALVDQTMSDTDDPLRSGQQRHEIEANAFASAVLMPDAAIRQARAQRSFDAHAEARRFGVSAEAFFYRLQHLRLL